MDTAPSACRVPGTRGPSLGTSPVRPRMAPLLDAGILSRDAVRRRGRWDGLPVALLAQSPSVTPSMASVQTQLSVRGRGIAQLAGIEAFISLASLDLADNLLVDPSPLAALRRLRLRTSRPSPGWTACSRW